MGGFFLHVLLHYNDLSGVYIFSQSTLSGVEGRLGLVADLVWTARSSKGEPYCKYYSPSCLPGQLLNNQWSLSDYPCSTCSSKPVPGHSSSVLLSCNVTYESGIDDLPWRTEKNVCSAWPPEIGSWLRKHAPGPADTIAPQCFRGFVRTNAAAIRKRPLGHYERIMAQLVQCDRPEVAHFVERAMLYLFASL